MRCPQMKCRVAAFIPGVGWAAAGSSALTGAGLIGKGTGCY